MSHLTGREQRQEQMISYIYLISAKQEKTCSERNMHCNRPYVPFYGVCENFKLINCTIRIIRIVYHRDHGNGFGQHDPSPRILGLVVHSQCPKIALHHSVSCVTEFRGEAQLLPPPAKPSRRQELHMPSDDEQTLITSLIESSST